MIEIVYRLYSKKVLVKLGGYVDTTYMKRYNLFLSQRQIKWLMEMSKDMGLSVSEIIRRAIDEYIRNNKVRIF